MISILLSDILATFLSMLLVAALATWIGWFLAKRPVQQPMGFRPKLRLFFFTWIFVFFVAIFAEPALFALHLQEHIVAGFGRFLIPLIAGSWFAKIRARLLFVDSGAGAPVNIRNSDYE